MNPNSITPASPAPTGRRYWRSLDELSDTPEFKEWLHREFPQGASEFSDPVSRRHFVKIMSASFALAGLGLAASGCRRPEEELVPFSKRRRRLRLRHAGIFCDGHADAHRRDSVGRQILRWPAHQNRGQRALSRRQRRHATATRRLRFWIFTTPTAHSVSRRETNPAMETVSRDEALNFLDELSKKFAANQGEGLAFLAESSTSPSRARLQKIIGRNFRSRSGSPMTRLIRAFINARQRRRSASRCKPVFHFDKAKVILSLDCDFIGSEDGAHKYIR